APRAIGIYSNDCGPKLTLILYRCFRRFFLRTRIGPGIGNTAGILWRGLGVGRLTRNDGGLRIGVWYLQRMQGTCDLIRRGVATPLVDTLCHVRVEWQFAIHRQ